MDYTLATTPSSILLCHLLVHTIYIAKLLKLQPSYSRQFFVSRANCTKRTMHQSNKGQCKHKKTGIKPPPTVPATWPLTSRSSRCELRLWMSLFLGALLGNCALLSLLALQGHRWSYQRGTIQVQQDSTAACYMMCFVVILSAV